MCTYVTAAETVRVIRLSVGVLVNNVGVQTDNGKPVHLLSEDTWDQVMNVNLKSYFLMAKHCLPDMLDQQAGVIINVGSVQGRQSQVSQRMNGLGVTETLTSFLDGCPCVVHVLPFQYRYLQVALFGCRWLAVL